MRRLAAIGALAAVASAAPPAAGQMQMTNRAQTPSALSLQALALLDRGIEHRRAERRLDLALRAKPAGDVQLEALRAAHRALHREDVAAGRRLLESAFPKGHRHLVGTTFRPDIRSSRLIAAALGALALVAATVALVRKRRDEAENA